MQRRADIDLTKGVAILLVVFGHLVARTDPANVEWYEPLRRAVYSFHMPLFLYLSGLVAVLSGGVLAPHAAWPGIVKAKARRLLLPFFGLGVIVVFGKLLASHFIYVDNAPSGLVRGLADLVWHTQDSTALSIWYLFVLFVVSLATMALLDGGTGRLWWLLGGALVLYTLPLPEYFYLDHIGRYAVFFVAGVAAGVAGAGWDGFMDRNWRWLMGIFAAGLLVVICFGTGLKEALTLLPLGMLSMPAIHGWLRHSGASLPRVFIFLGRYSFMIYLFNTSFIGLAKGVLLHFYSWNGMNFIPFAMALMAAGIFGPVMLKRQLFTRVHVLDRLSN